MLSEIFVKLYKLMS